MRETYAMVSNVSLNELQRIKKWHVAHRAEHPLEYHLLDAVLTIWMMGWVGWMPAMMFDAEWAFPFCALGMALPTLYVRWRARAHAMQRVRCDWIDFKG